MKKFVMLFCACLSLAQDSEVKVVPPADTATLSRLKSEYDQSEKAMNAAYKHYQDEQARVRVAAGATNPKTSDCLTVNNNTTINNFAPCWSWRFSYDFKYLVRY
jgi:hypothetical protein